MNPAAVAAIAYDNLLLITLAALAAPLLATAIRLPIPEVVLMIVAGIILGPSVLGWVEIDEPVQVLSALGLAYLLFVAGLSIELEKLRGQGLGVGLRSFGLSVVLSVLAAVCVAAIGPVDNIGLLTAVFLTTALDIVVSVLKNAGRVEDRIGQLALFGGALGASVSVVLVSFVFAEQSQSTGARFLLLSVFAITVVVAVGAIVRAGAVEHLRRTLVALSEAATQVTVRASFALMVAFAALAAALGLAAILGAFAAGVAVSVIDAGHTGREQFRVKLEAVGFGVLAPIFFVATGAGVDLGALTAETSTLGLVPVLLVAFAVARLLPAVVYRRTLPQREWLALGLLQSSKLTFVAAVVAIGVEADAIGPGVAAALIVSSLLSVIVFPTIASVLLRPQTSTRRGGQE